MKTNIAAAKVSNSGKRPTAWWRLLGPGLVTGAADDDPSGIATYSQAGAQFGANIAWTIVLTYPLMVAIQFASARIGRVTGNGLCDNFIALYPSPIVYGLVALLCLANVINLGADLNAMGDAVRLVVGGPASLYACLFGLASVALLVFLPYRRYVNILKWLTLSLFAYVGVAFSVHVNWPSVMHDTFLPKLAGSKQYITTVVAVFGTTISPYLFFWQADQEVEEIRRIPRDHPLKTAPQQASEQLHRLRLDTVVGMGISNAIALFIILATTATLHAHGVTNIETTTQAASALKPIAGNIAFLLFALGIIGTGLLALPVLAGSAAFAVGSIFHWKKGLYLAPSRAIPFYSVVGLAILLGVALSTMEANPIQALYWSAVINAVIAVPIMVAVMHLAANTKRMGRWVLPPAWRALGWAATAVMGAASLAMFATMLP